MKKSVTENEVFELLARYFEETAFIFVDIYDDPEPFNDEIITSKIGFGDNDETGTMFFSTPKEFAMEMAANLLGVNPDEANLEQKSTDAVSELLNIISGGLTEIYFGIEGGARFGLPDTTTISENEYNNVAKKADLHIPMISDEGFRLDFIIQWN